MKLPRELSLGEIAAVTGGQVEGPADLKVHSVALSPFAAGPGELALVFEPKLVKRIHECRASAVVVAEGVKSELPKVIVQRPMLALQRMLLAVQPKRFFPGEGIHPTAVVDPSAELGTGVSLGPLVVIGPLTKIGNNTRIMANCVIGGGVSIGQDCLFHPGCMIADYVQIGNRVIMQQGASVGSDGFGYVTENISNLERRLSGSREISQQSNPHLKIPQIGTVIIEDDVEIGSNSTIDRATMGATVIGQGTKIDNLVMIAHNCRVGKEAIIVSQTGLAGSVTVGDRAILAGQAGIVDHIRIGADVIVEGQSGVMRDVPDGEVVCGSPAHPHREFMTNSAMIRKTPRMYDDIKALQKKVAELEALLQSQPVGKEG